MDNSIITLKNVRLAFPQKLANPGAKLTAMDRYLRRVDPPADDTEDEAARELVTAGPTL